MAADGIAVAHEDNHLLVVIKPAGLATTAPPTGPGGGDCLTQRLERARGGSLHPSSRLDAEVTGLVTFAKTKRAIEALLRARSEGRYGRGYLAITTHTLAPAEGTWDAAIAIDPHDPRLRIALDAGRSAAEATRVQHARTTYVVREATAHGAALWLTPHTGRTHQLRVHAAHAGAPLFGDVRYQGDKRVALPDGRVITARRVLLHCAWLRLPGIEARGALELSAPAPDDMRSAWSALGGAVESLAALPSMAPRRD